MLFAIIRKNGNRGRASPAVARRESYNHLTWRVPNLGTQATLLPMNTRILFLLRLLIAGGFTLGVLPYCWAYSLVLWMMTGRVDWRFAGLFVLGLVLTAMVVRDLASHFTSPTVRAAILPLLLITWVAEHVVLVWLSAGELSPRPALWLVLSASTIWIPWTAWLFYGHPSWNPRVFVLAVFLLAAPAFPLLFTVQGLAGDAMANFAWRWQASQSFAGLDFPEEKIDSGIADLTKTTPNDFPQFLGRDRTAVIPHVRLARDWTANPPRLLWRRPVGVGWSAFAVVGEFAVTQEQRGAHECVVCYRLKDGARIWIHADPVRFDSSLGGPGPRATPTIAGGRVYSVGATGLLNCLDGATGKSIWSVPILEDNGGARIEHGVCGSPLVLDDLVIVVPTGRDGVSLVAYDRATGKQVWQGGENRGSYASPLFAEFQGVRQILLHNSGGVAAHDPTTGKVLWSFPLTNGEDINCGMPILDAGKPGRVFAATGYNTGSTLWQVERKPDGAWVEPEQVWKSRQMKAKFTTVVMRDGHVYGLDDGYLACVDLKTGRAKWKDRRFRYKHGQLLLVGDLLLIQAEEGDICLVETNPEELREVASISALEGKTWNNPVLAGRYLLVRNDKEAMCFELTVESPR